MGKTAITAIFMAISFSSAQAYDLSPIDLSAVGINTLGEQPPAPREKAIYEMNGYEQLMENARRGLEMDRNNLMWYGTKERMCALQMQTGLGYGRPGEKWCD